MVIFVRFFLTIITEAALNVNLKILNELAKMIFIDVILVSKNKIIQINFKILKYIPIHGKEREDRDFLISLLITPIKPL